MKISTKGRYGLKAMIDLAINSLGDHVSLKSIAERQGISENYLEQVFSALRKSELVKSVKGPQGGYLLGRSADKITAGDILRALEGNLSVVNDSAADSADSMERFISDNVWSKINESIAATVDSILLENLAYEYKKLKKAIDIEYFI